MKGTAVIINGELRLSKDLLHFVLENDDSELDIELTVLNKPEHFLYKYYWGYLLPDIIIHSGLAINKNSVNNKAKIDLHEEMKENFAKENVDDWTDIPRRHRYKCQRFERIDEHGEVTRWYIKSTSSMTHEELKDYICQVEQHYFSFLAGHLDPKTQQAAYEMRVKGMMDAKQLKKKLKEAG